MQIGQTFNTTEAPKNDFEPVPAGDYVCVVDACEQKMTKAGNGSYAQLTLQVVDGPFKGRKLWERLNLDNPNAQAVAIAQETVCAMAHAAGLASISDTDQLIGQVVGAKVVVRSDPKYGESNEIKRYFRPVAAAMAPPAAPVAQPQQAAQAPAGVPWLQGTAA